jgi:guanylate kinase
VSSGDRGAAVSIPEPPDLGARKTRLLFVLSGPSGVGKSTIIQQLRADGFRLGRCVTATTRPRREYEQHGVDYYFWSDEEFDRRARDGRLLEHAIVHGQKKGVPIEGVQAGLDAGDDVLIPPDVQGAATLKRVLPNAITIFLAPPSLEELIRRLTERNTESPDQLERRIRDAPGELARLSEFEYVVVNERDRDRESVEQIKAIVTAERCRVTPRNITPDELLAISRRCHDG